MPGLEATLYEDPGALPATPLPGRAAIARSEHMVLLIEPNIGPTESNPYRQDSDALARLVGSLRPFEPPPE